MAQSAELEVKVRSEHLVETLNACRKVLFELREELKEARKVLEEIRTERNDNDNESEL